MGEPRNLKQRFTTFPLPFTELHCGVANTSDTLAIAMPIGRPSYNAHIPVGAQVRPWDRPVEDTVFAKWLRETGTSFASFARQAHLRADHVRYLARGQVLPDLCTAFCVQATTKGAVLASSWLGTTLGRQVWNNRAAYADSYWRKYAQAPSRQAKGQRRRRAAVLPPLAQGGPAGAGR